MYTQTFDLIMYLSSAVTLLRTLTRKLSITIIVSSMSCGVHFTAALLDLVVNINLF